MHIKLYVSVFFIASYLSVPGFAQSLIVFDDDSQALPLATGVEYMVDRSGTLTFEQLSGDNIEFRLLTERQPNFGKTRAAVWLRFKLRNESDKDLFLQLQRPTIHYLDIYSSDRHDFEPRHTGALRKWDSRGVQSHLYYVLLLPSGEEGTFYVRLKSDLNLDVPISIGTFESSLAIERRHNIQLTLQGALAALMLYNFFIWLLVRDRAYMLYALCLLFKLVSLDMLFTGIGFQFFWPQYPAINLSLSSLIALSFVFTLLFASALLNTRTQFPRWQPLFFVFYAFASVIVIANLLGNFFVADILDHIFGMSSTLFLFILGIVALRSQVTVGLYFLMALVFLIATIIFHALYVEGILPTNPLSYHIALLGNVAEALMFAFALAHKIKTLQNQKEQLQVKQIELVEHHNQTLAFQVQQRTEEIAAQNEELVSQQEQISLQNKLLHEAKASLEQEVATRLMELMNANKELVGQNHQLEQFAFIIAHNLRSPVARIQGLGNILALANSEDETRFVNQKMVESANELNAVLTDLSRILDIRKGMNSSYVTVDVMDCLSKVKVMLKEELRVSGTTIEVHTSGDTHVFSLLPYVESILYNLISNGIKYRSPDRPPAIQITIERKESELLIFVKDNGLGINIKRHGNKLFGLYQRFHLHLEGKGMGLHLVKLQTEAIGGKISVESQEGVGTIFMVALPVKGSEEMATVF